jgi:hypothetical protein
MIVKLPVTNQVNQSFTIPSDDGSIKLFLRFHSVATMWTIDAERNTKKAQGMAVNVGGSHFASSLMNLDVRCVDTSGIGVDPYSLDCFDNGRCELLVVFDEVS